MKKKTINGLLKKKERLIDQSGYLSKRVAMRILEKYANEIDMVLTKYNKKSCNTTMMIKGYRKSEQETTNRKIHQEELGLIAGQKAKGLHLCEGISRVIGNHHDIRHTFLGHSGEWWISSILEDYGLGIFSHTALGAADLIYKYDFYDKTINTIKHFHPQITDKEINRIRKSLWLIIDAINSHNGEKPDKEFVPNSRKSEKDFEDEIKKCFSKNGQDRNLIPATSEACLMRLADRIAYIPLDMIDGIREGLVRDKDGNIIDYLDDDYKSILMKIGLSEDEIEESNKKKNYEAIAEKLKTIFINDVIANSTKRRIKMSADCMNNMIELLNLNNRKAVDNVVLIEDQETYPPAIRELINKFKDIILDNNILQMLSGENQSTEFNYMLQKFKKTPYQSFIKYLCNINKRDYEFTKQIVESATRESVKDELVMARTNVEKDLLHKDKQELGLDYSNKNYRMKKYETHYKKKLERGELIEYNEFDLEEEINFVIEGIKKQKQNSRFFNMDERMALMIGARYIASLNDIEFMNLLLETGLVNEEKYKSLTRKYKDIPDLIDNVYIHKKWTEITKENNRATGNREK